MSITTKTGDNGMTYLYMGGKVSKDDIRVEAYGSIDELCSFLGMSKTQIKDKKIKNMIESIQKDLFVVSSELAVCPKFINKIKEKTDQNCVDKIEKFIKMFERKKVPKLHCFAVPGNNFISSILDVSRTVARRAERRIVTLKNKKDLKNNYILIYLNRLSDLLYLLARYYDKHV
jgi:cob(I)alamin adenosyltransferase